MKLVIKDRKIARFKLEDIIIDGTVASVEVMNLLNPANVKKQVYRTEMSPGDVLDIKETIEFEGSWWEFFKALVLKRDVRFNKGYNRR